MPQPHPCSLPLPTVAAGWYLNLSLTFIPVADSAPVTDGASGDANRPGRPLKRSPVLRVSACERERSQAETLSPGAALRGQRCPSLGASMCSPE